jgi:hypothetical protein
MCNGCRTRKLGVFHQEIPMGRFCYAFPAARPKIGFEFFCEISSHWLAILLGQSRKEMYIDAQKTDNNRWEITVNP